MLLGQTRQHVVATLAPMLSGDGEFSGRGMDRGGPVQLRIRTGTGSFAGCPIEPESLATRHTNAELYLSGAHARPLGADIDI